MARIPESGGRGRLSGGTGRVGQASRVDSVHVQGSMDESFLFLFFKKQSASFLKKRSKKLLPMPV
jgi:hypothetical protein